MNKVDYYGLLTQVSAISASLDPPPAACVASGSDLTPLELEVIDLFVGATRLIGLPRSLGEIYGFLFISPEPVTLDQLVQRLSISKGSASQGLRALRTIGAVKLSHQPGDRRDHYTAETELKSLVSGFISGQMLPHLETGQTRLGRLRAIEESMGPELRPIQRARLEKLVHWHHRARTLAPLAGKFLD